MTKYVVNNSQVPHLWAHQSQDHAKGNGSISFKGPCLYSYQALIGYLTKSPTGETVALLTTRRWSNTTNGHQSAARSAVSHMVHFELPSIDARFGIDHAANMAHLMGAYSNSIAKLKRMRNLPNDWQWEALQKAYDTVLAYARVFNLNPPAMDYVALERAAILAIHNEPKRVAKRTAAAIAQSERAAAYAKDKHLQNQQAIADWRAGVRESLPYDARMDSTGKGAMVRVIGDKLQTSLGATVPLSDAIKVFRRIAACKNANVHWHRNGEIIHVGDFHIDEINPNGSFRAGCHFFNWEEIENTARTIGIIDA